MKVLANENVVISSNKYYDEIDELIRYINTQMVSIFDYLLLSTNKMCDIHILDNKDELNMLYLELMMPDNKDIKHTEVSSKLASFIYNDDLFILNYDAYINVYQHNKTTREEYYAEVVSNLVHIFQIWKYGKLSESEVINKGLAAFLSGQDVHSKVLIDSYVDFVKSNNVKSFGDFYRFIDSVLDKESIKKLLASPIDPDYIRKLYDGYKHQIFKNRSME